jgi:tRNA nucleotidyltransferase (CCA-adding enzyme)
MTERRSEHFPHDADIGIRGIGPTCEAAFEEAALALTAAITDVAQIRCDAVVGIECAAPNDALLLVDWLNALIYRMSVDRMLFGRFAVTIQDGTLRGKAWGEAVDRVRHAPAVEPKGATLTAHKVERDEHGAWVAQCVIDV